MTLKLTENRLEALGNLLGVMIDLITPESIPDKLLIAMVAKIHERIAIKLIRRLDTSKTTTQLKLSDVEAMALYTFWQKMNTLIDKDAWQYEAIVMQRIYQDIDRELA